MRIKILPPKPCPPLSLALSLSLCLLTLACAKPNEERLEQKTRQKNNLKLPTEQRFAIGDTFTYNNPQMTWRITEIVEDRLLWQSEIGERMETSANPFLPALAWQSNRYGQGRRSITQMRGSLFPLKKGKRLKFVANTNFDGKRKNLTWNCFVGGKQKTRTPAGIFDTIEVLCQRIGADALIYKYSPALARVVEFRTPGLGLAPVVQRQLVSYASSAGVVHKTARGIEILPPLPLNPDEQPPAPYRPSPVPIAPLPFAQPPADFFAPQLDSTPQQGLPTKPESEPLQRILEQMLERQKQQQTQAQPQVPLLPQFTPLPQSDNDDESETPTDTTKPTDTSEPEATTSEPTDTTEPKATTSAVRLGEYSSLSLARQTWQKLNGEFAALFSGRRYDIIRRTDEAQGILYALYAHPYINDEAAQDVCDTIRKKYRSSSCGVIAWQKK